MKRIIAIFTALAILMQAAVAEQEIKIEEDVSQYIIPHKERSFDFKTVAKGMVLGHRFVLKNPFQEPMHIASVTASCTCTTVDFDEKDETKTTLNTYEEAVIPIRLRGDISEGPQNATLTVIIDRPKRIEIQLNVRAEIRADLRIAPNNFIDFGNIELGRGQSRTLTVTYTGSNAQWRLVDVQCDNEFIHTEITSDPERIGIKTFRVRVSLDQTAPNGNINSRLILISNDSASRREIPVPLRATVGTVITVSPPNVFLGMLPPGEPSPKKNAFLTGTKPFRITTIECDNPAVEIVSHNVASRTEPDAPSRIHSLLISYRNPAEGEGSPQDNGEMRAEVQITTDLPGLTATFHVTASVRENETATSEENTTVNQ